MVKSQKRSVGSLLEKKLEIRNGVSGLWANESVQKYFKKERIFSALVLPEAFAPFTHSMVETAFPFEILFGQFADNSKGNSTPSLKQKKLRAP